MVTEKVMHFQGKNLDLAQLSKLIKEQLESEGYQTQVAAVPLGQVVQAKKAGVLRDIITADRAYSILITGKPDDFTVHIGIGRWIQNIAVATAETVLLTWLFLAVDVPEMLWTVHVENGIAKEVAQIVERPQKASLKETAKPEYEPAPVPGASRADSGWGKKPPNDIATERDHPDPNPV